MKETNSVISAIIKNNNSNSSNKSTGSFALRECGLILFANRE